MAKQSNGGRQAKHSADPDSRPVSKACVNCRLSKLKCNNERPCSRCLFAGKEMTCVDYEPLPRGRKRTVKDERRVDEACQHDSANSATGGIGSMASRANPPLKRKNSASIARPRSGHIDPTDTIYSSRALIKAANSVARGDRGLDLGSKRRRSSLAEVNSPEVGEFLSNAPYGSIYGAHDDSDRDAASPNGHYTSLHTRQDEGQSEYVDAEADDSPYVNGLRMGYLAPISGYSHAVHADAAAAEEEQRGHVHNLNRGDTLMTAQRPGLDPTSSLRPQFDARRPPAPVETSTAPFLSLSQLPSSHRGSTPLMGVTIISLSSNDTPFSVERTLTRRAVPVSMLDTTSPLSAGRRLSHSNASPLSSLPRVLSTSSASLALPGTGSHDGPMLSGHGASTRDMYPNMDTVLARVDSSGSALARVSSMAPSANNGMGLGLAHVFSSLSRKNDLPRPQSQTHSRLSFQNTIGAGLLWRADSQDIGNRSSFNADAARSLHASLTDGHSFRLSTLTDGVPLRGSTLAELSLRSSSATDVPLRSTASTDLPNLPMSMALGFTSFNSGSAAAAPMTVADVIARGDLYSAGATGLPATASDSASNTRALRPGTATSAHTRLTSTVAEAAPVHTPTQAHLSPPPAIAASASVSPTGFAPSPTPSSTRAPSGAEGLQQFLYATPQHERAVISPTAHLSMHMRTHSAIHVPAPPHRYGPPGASRTPTPNAYTRALQAPTPSARPSQDSFCFASFTQMSLSASDSARSTFNVPDTTSFGRSTVHADMLSCARNPSAPTSMSLSVPSTAPPQTRAQSQSQPMKMQASSVHAHAQAPSLTPAAQPSLQTACGSSLTSDGAVADAKMDDSPQLAQTASCPSGSHALTLSDSSAPLPTSSSTAPLLAPPSTATLLATPSPGTLLSGAPALSPDVRVHGVAPAGVQGHTIAPTITELQRQVSSSATPSLHLYGYSDGAHAATHSLAGSTAASALVGTSALLGSSVAIAATAANMSAAAAAASMFTTPSLAPPIAQPLAPTLAAPIVAPVFASDAPSLSSPAHTSSMHTSLAQTAPPHPFMPMGGNPHSSAYPSSTPALLEPCPVSAPTALHAHALSQNAQRSLPPPMCVPVPATFASNTFASSPLTHTHVSQGFSVHQPAPVCVSPLAADTMSSASPIARLPPLPASTLPVDADVYQRIPLVQTALSPPAQGGTLTLPPTTASVQAATVSSTHAPAVPGPVTVGEMLPPMPLGMRDYGAPPRNSEEPILAKRPSVGLSGDKSTLERE